MYKRNRRHLQIPLTSHVDELPTNLRNRLEKSWARTFYREFFCRLNENLFEVLYSDLPSRPNVPINVLVGLEYLKAGNGWTDEEMYDNFCYDIQVRYALGYRQLSEGYFDLRTLYYFRERLSRYMQESGRNLLDEAFEQVTDEQVAAFEIKTGKQRMDSTQVASNIRQIGRVQLLVTVLQRVYQMLTETDREVYQGLFAPYFKGHAGQYVYRMKREEIVTHLQQIGTLMQQLLDKLRPVYGSEAIYQVLERVFGEHYQLKGSIPEAKPNEALSATSLQSPDDLEATYREKRGQGYQGYVANVAETCDPENDLQLITKVQVAPNNTDDSKLLIEALPDLTERTDLDTLYTDGGHGSPAADIALQIQHIEHLQTAIRGRKQNPDKLHLADFDIEFDDDGNPFAITCPQGQTVSVKPSLQKKAWVAHFATETCAACPLADQCPAHPQKRDPRFHLRFTKDKAHAAKRRRQSQKQQQEGRNLRAAVEATMRSLKHPFPAGKLPVRGIFRVTCLLIGSAAVTNIRRIQRYMESKWKDQNQLESTENKQNSTQKMVGDSFFRFFSRVFRCQIPSILAFNPLLDF